MVHRLRPLVALAVLITALSVAASAQATTFRLLLQFTSAPAKISNVSSPQFAFVRNLHYGVRSQLCRVDAKPWHACRSPWMPGHLADGVHTVRISLTLVNGAKASTAYSWRILTVAPPVPTVTGGMTSWTSAASDTLHASSTNSYLSQIQYRESLDNGAWGAVRVGSAATVSQEGSTAVEFRVVDKAGNVGGWSTSTSVMLDRTGPTPPSIYPVGYENNNLVNWTPVTVSTNGTSSDANGSLLTSGVASYEYRTSADQGTTWTAPQVGTSFNLAGEGSYLVEVRAIDQAGNPGDWSASTAVGIDLTPPATPTSLDDDEFGLSWTRGIYIMNLMAIWPVTNGDDPDLDYTKTQFRYKFDGGSTWVYPMTVNGGFYVQGYPSGTYLVEASVGDFAGNVSGWSSPTAPGALFGTDMTPPTPPTVTETINGSGTATFDWAGTSTDAGVGLSGWYETEYSYDGGQTWAGSGPSTRWAQGTSITFNPATDCPAGGGSIAIRVIAEDAFDNLGDWDNGDYTNWSTPVVDPTLCPAS